jgi:hypothetical protein
MCHRAPRRSGASLPTQACRIEGAVFHDSNTHCGFQEKWLVSAFTIGGATYQFGAGPLLEVCGAAMGSSTMAASSRRRPRQPADLAGHASHFAPILARSLGVNSRGMESGAFV